MQPSWARSADKSTRCADERQVAQLLERILDAGVPRVIAAYEERIRKLEEEKLPVEEQTASSGRPASRMRVMPGPGDEALITTPLRMSSKTDSGSKADRRPRPRQLARTAATRTARIGSPLRRAMIRIRYGRPCRLALSRNRFRQAATCSSRSMRRTARFCANDSAARIPRSRDRAEESNRCRPGRDEGAACARARYRRQRRSRPGW